MTPTPKDRQRVIFINRFFYPDPSATSQILSDLAFALAEAGFAVTVITSQRSTSANVSFPRAETINAVEIIRVTTLHGDQNRLIGRAMEYLQFYAAATFLLFSKVGRGDILVAKTDPPLISVLAAIVARLRSAKLVNWLQDLYPEVAEKLGVPFLRGPMGWSLRWARDCALQSAHVNVAIGSGMARYIREKGIAANRIETIENWVDDSDVQPLSSADNWFFKKVAKQGEFIVGYCGNLGRAHEFETLLGAARLLADREDILFLFVGGGHYIRALRSKVEAEGLEKHFRFLSMQPLRRLKFSLAAPQVHWISLRPELEGLIVPSKFYGILAAGRPTFAIMSRTGEIPLLLERHGCGIVIEPGDSTELASQILRLKNEPATCATMGRRARDLLERKFARRDALTRWIDLLRNV